MRIESHITSQTMPKNQHKSAYITILNSSMQKPQKFPSVLSIFKRILKNVHMLHLHEALAQQNFIKNLFRIFLAVCVCKKKCNLIIQSRTTSPSHSLFIMQERHFKRHKKGSEMKNMYVVKDRRKRMNE